MFSLFIEELIAGGALKKANHGDSKYTIRIVYNIVVLYIDFSYRIFMLYMYIDTLNICLWVYNVYFLYNM